MDKKKEIEDLNNEKDLFQANHTCRLCGCKSDLIVQDIFDINKDILEKISSCLPIVILPFDSFPKKICDLCCGTLEIVVNFIRKSIATDEEFKSRKEIQVRNIVVSSLPLNGPVECNVCRTSFTDMTLFDKHTEEHKSEMEYPLETDFVQQKSSAYSIRKPPTVTRCHCGELISSKFGLKFHKCNGKNVRLKIGNKFSKKDISNNSDDGKFQEKILIMKQNKVIKKPQKKLFSCNFCNETFSNNKELKIHSQQIHNISMNAEWVCKFCNKSMTTKVGLLIHERIHDGSKPYICEWCGNGFRSRANLTQHQVIHTGIRKYSCSRCNKKFSRRSFVETHMRVHTGERPYCCDICGYRFTQIGDMRRHRNKHQTYTATFPTNNTNSNQFPS